MPAAYAHYTFGKKVFDRLSSPVKSLITASPLHKKLFAIGLQGPDILFFYHPYCRNDINSAGNRMHAEPAAQLLDRARFSNERPLAPDLMSYLLGVVCHYALDSRCHPYISKRMTVSKATHHQIESEFDRMLMEMDGLDPLDFNPAAYAWPDCETAAVISSAFPGISPSEIYDSLKGMAVIRDILTGRNAPKRLLLHYALLWTPLNGLSMPAVPSACCIHSNKRLLSIYQDTVEEGVSLVEDFCRLADQDGPLPESFQRTFE